MAKTREQTLAWLAKAERQLDRKLEEVRSAGLSTHELIDRSNKFNELALDGKLRRLRRKG